MCNAVAAPSQRAAAGATRPTPRGQLLRRVRSVVPSSGQRRTTMAKPPASAAAPTARNAICKAGTPEPEPSNGGAPPVVGRPDSTATMLPGSLPALRTAVATPLASVVAVVSRPPWSPHVKRGRGFSPVRPASAARAPHLVEQARLRQPLTAVKGASGHSRCFHAIHGLGGQATVEENGRDL